MLVKQRWLGVVGMENEAALRHATKEKYLGLFSSVLGMSVKDKRSLFCILRQQKERASPDLFLPSYGLHCGEFACFQILSEYARKERRVCTTGEPDAASRPDLPEREEAVEEEIVCLSARLREPSMVVSA